MFNDYLYHNNNNKSSFSVLDTKLISIIINFNLFFIGYTECLAIDFIIKLKLRTDKN